MPDSSLDIHGATGEDDLRWSPRGLLALLALPGVGPTTALRAALLTTNYDALLEKHARLWSEALERAEELLDRQSAAGITALSIFEDRYPARLRELHDPPPVLFVHGSVDVLHKDRIAAVVGTREPTSFGCRAAEKITAALAAAGWAVISGLAKGIDTLAHGAALKHQTETVAVMAGGLDRIYPAENRELAAAIVDRGGAMLSEYPCGTRPQRSNFVMRNRLQTGLSVAVVIAQTDVVGGTMHTARHAAMQGRPIFCPKPRSNEKQNAGLRALLSVPGRQLCGVLPGWQREDSLCRRLGDQPIAWPVTSDRLEEFVDALELALSHASETSTRWWPAMDPPSRFGARDAVEVDDEQGALFALTD